MTLLPPTETASPPASASHRRVWALWLLALGLVLFLGLLIYQGAAEILATVASAGWGLVLIGLLHALPLWATAVAWRTVILLDRPKPSVFSLFWMRWIADSINALLPVAQIGGELVRGRFLVTRFAVPGAVTAAGIIVDLTAALLSLVLFMMSGVGILFLREGGAELAFQLLGGIGFFFLMLALFYVLQRHGALLWLARRLEGMVSGQGWSSLTGGMAALDQALLATYQQRRAVILCLVWRLLAWYLGAFEIWAALHIIGYPVSFLDALIIESLGQAGRNIGFLIPGALGIQEGGYMLGAVLAGLTADAGLALAITKRVRDLLIGIPALLLWQVLEGRGLLGGKSRPSEREKDC